MGIATLPDEVLPDDLYPRERVIVSPEVADRYDCLPDAPTADASIEEAAALLFPPGCATSYQYYSLEVEGGARGVAAALGTFVDGWSGRRIRPLPRWACWGWSSGRSRLSCWGWRRHASFAVPRTTRSSGGGWG